MTPSDVFMRKLTHAEIVQRRHARSPQTRLPFTVVLNDIRSLHNAGSIFRTCDGAGVEKLWLCGITGYPPSAQLAKTALGAEGCVPWEYREDVHSVLEELKARHYEVVLLEQTTRSIPYEEFKPRGPVCLVVGNEIEGVAHPLVALCDAAVEIAMAGAKNSLNVSVAFGIAAYHIRSCLMKNKNIFLVLPACLALLTSSAGWAEEPRDPRVSAVVASRHIYSSDIKATDGEIDITSTGFDVTYTFKAAGRLPVDISLDVRHIDINADTPVDLPSHLEARHLGLAAKFSAPFIHDDRFFMGLDIFPTINTDGWDWTSGAFRLPFRSYLIFKESDDFILVGGVSVRPEYEREMIPLIGLVYRPTDRLSLNLASDDPNISYRLNDATMLRWELDYAWEEYEVTRGTQEGVVLQYQGISSGFGIEHQFNETFKGVVSAGGVFNRRLEYKDEVGKVAPDTGFYTSLQLKATF